MIYTYIVPYYEFKQVQSNTKNQINFKFHSIVYRNLNATVFSKRFPTINTLYTE